MSHVRQPHDKSNKSKKTTNDVTTGGTRRGTAVPTTNIRDNLKLCAGADLSPNQLGFVIPRAPNRSSIPTLNLPSDRRIGGSETKLDSDDGPRLPALEFGPASHPDISTWQRRSAAQEPNQGALTAWSVALGTPLSDVTLHRDTWAERIATVHDAAAVTIGTHIYLGHDAQPSILAHELVHVAQGKNQGAVASTSALEHEANTASAALMMGQVPDVTLKAAPTTPLRHPGATVIRRAATWLSRRATNTVSKHIARHGRRIAGRAVHTVFRSPKKIRSMLQSTVREALAITQRATRHGADDVIEEGAYRVMRQSTATPGKFRWVVQRRFDRPIGKQGEMILRIVIDETGRVVTAFPVDRLLTLGVAGGAIDLFTAQTAEASERVAGLIEADQRARDERQVGVMEAIIDFLLDPSVANEGEELMLNMDREILRTTQNVIQEIEAQEQITLTSEQRAEIEELVRVSVGAPMLDEEDE